VRAGALATVLVVGLLAVVHWGLSGSDGGATPADAAIAPAHGSTTTGHHARASATRTTLASRQDKRPAPYHVVRGTVVAHKSQAQLARELKALLATHSFDFTLGTFNVLGSQHSTATGDHARYPAASVRSAGAAALMRRHGVDVVGTQELKPDQLNEITRLTGMKAWPGYAFGSRDTDNSILYDPSKFAFVSGTSFPVKFMNAVRPQTVLLLKELSTGREVYFVNVHVSAVTAPRYQASHVAGHYATAAEINKLKATGIPVFLTGDMNDRSAFYCRVVPLTHLVAAVGGNVDGGCHPAPHLAVDWVLGSAPTTFTNYWEDRSPIGRISDHFFVSATAHVPGA
jgi:endonuclease/exonuclease/phosphatase family metal-dependent hydrolase